MQIANEMSKRWQILANDLKVDRNEIFKIIENPMMPVDKCAQMLLRWRAALPLGNNGKKELMEALDSCNRHDLVVNILGPRAGMTSAVLSLYILKSASCH